MSERTLQRRITEQGTTFRNLLAEARQELAHTLLSEGHVDVEETAFMLGFEDPNSFYRAFRVRWLAYLSTSRWQPHSPVHRVVAECAECMEAKGWMIRGAWTRNLTS